MLGPSRPDSIYWYYANGVATVEGQGYTIHHAAGWYLNFGFPGVILGACLLGRVWAALYNNVARGALRQDATAWRMFCIVGFFTFTANLPTLIRLGPEGYKGILVDSFIAPMSILLLSRSQQHRSFRPKTASRNSSLSGIRPPSPTLNGHGRGYSMPRRQERTSGRSK